MKITHLLPVAALALPILLALACRKDDGTTPNPNSPIQPSAGPADTPRPKASAVGSTVEKAGEAAKPKP